MKSGVCLVQCRFTTHAQAYAVFERSKKQWCDMCGAGWCGAKVYGYCLSGKRSLLESYSDVLQ